MRHKETCCSFNSDWSCLARWLGTTNLVKLSHNNWCDRVDRPFGIDVVKGGQIANLHIAAVFLPFLVSCIVFFFSFLFNVIRPRIDCVCNIYHVKVCMNGSSISSSWCARKKWENTKSSVGLERKQSEGTPSHIPPLYATVMDECELVVLGESCVQLS